MCGRLLYFTVSLVAFPPDEGSIAGVGIAGSRAAGKVATKVRVPCRFFVRPLACQPRAPPFLLRFFSKEGQVGSMVVTLLLTLQLK